MISLLVKLTEIYQTIYYSLQEYSALNIMEALKDDQASSSNLFIAAEFLKLPVFNVI